MGEPKRVYSELREGLRDTCRSASPAEVSFAQHPEVRHGRPGRRQSRDRQNICALRARRPIRRRCTISSGAPRLFQTDTLWPYFERLRNEEPVHYCPKAPIEPYWSVTKYNDIMHVETNHGIFSSDVTSAASSLRDVPPGYRLAELHRDGPAEARRAAQDRGTDVHADALASWRS